ncbi:MAG: GNAT family N-acetyltransferase [Anaerolineales bacterium]|uniref:GNAT family N-acetyltransferase n=1 Tax=Candidatus Villigracilis proximus TaxID=3140683 RepID=UPI003136E838|nr:GNAT family N-acetyltransferase [Anaerolineales bacterium]MBK9211268.1 GNAT family N-acetyltransferase [Anaerolineales bacterium]
MKYTLHKDFSEINTQEWNDLVQGSVSDNPFLRYEYQRAWWEHRGGGEWANAQLVLVTAREDEKLIGIAPLFISEYDGQPALLLNGSIEISDYLDLIVRMDDHAHFITGLLDFLASSLADSWRGLDWYNLPDSSPTLAALKAESAQRGWTHLEEMYRPTPRIALNGDFDEYLSRVEKKQRHEIRRKIRRAEESERGVRWFISDMADVDAEIDAFLGLMEQDQGKAGFLQESMRDQMRAVIRTAHENGWLWLAFLEADGQRIAAALNFDYNNKLWGYNAGVNRAFMDLSPGWVLLGYVLQWCCENKRTEFDFMRGDEEYKYRFGAVNQYVMRVKLTRNQ